MMTIEKNLSDALGIEHTPRQPSTKEIVVMEPVEEPVEHDTKDEDEDYVLVRTTLRSLIEKGNDAIEEIVSIAKQNESARGFEVCSTLIKTVGETAKDLYSLQKTKKDLKDLKIDKNKPVDETTITVDKAVFVGTTAELLAQVKQSKKKDD